MATGFANFGSAVTVLARDGLLPLAEPFAGERVRKSLEEAGVSVHLGAEAVSVNRGGDGTVHVTLTDGEQVEADELLVAIGRWLAHGRRPASYRTTRPLDANEVPGAA